MVGLFKNQSGTWKAITDPNSNVSSVEKNVTDGYVRVSGVWKRLYQRQATLYSIMVSAGVTPKAAVDAAIAASYSGTGQTWADLSGNSADFYRGADGTSEATDPTFNGSAGAGTSSEYWGNDGGDKFTIASLPAWVSTLHKNSGVCTLVWLGRLPVGTNTTGVSEIFRTTNGSNQHGLRLYLKRELLEEGDPKDPTSSWWDSIILEVRSTTSVALFTLAGGVSVSAEGAFSAGDTFIAATWNEASATSLQAVVNDLTVTNGDPTYTSPSSTDATSVILIDAAGATTIGPPTRVYGFGLGDSATTLANLKTIEAALKAERSYGWTNAA